MSTIKPYVNSEDDKKIQVQNMFNKVSSNYDKLNRLITFGMDIKWRKNVMNIIASQNPINILDVATGTGDMPILYTKTKAKKIIGIDISDGMLNVARAKVDNLNLNNTIELKQGDAENLLYDNGLFDVVSVTYGIRNFENLNKGLSEILRVLKSKGMLVILETSIPVKFPYKQSYLFYTKRVMPLWGRLFSKDKKAYSYLSTSAINFPYGQELKTILEQIGFNEVKVIPQTKGFSTIYVASKS